MNPWADLVALAERERDLVRDEQYEEAAQAGADRLKASLALGQAPVTARPELERLLELQLEINAGLQSARAFTARRLGEMNRGAAAVRGYGTGRATASAVNSRA